MCDEQWRLTARVLCGLLCRRAALASSLAAYQPCCKLAVPRVNATRQPALLLNFRALALARFLDLPVASRNPPRMAEPDSGGSDHERNDHAQGRDGNGARGDVAGHTRRH